MHGRRGVLTEWDSVHPNGTEVHLQSVFLDDLLYTRYEAGTCHDGTEGELYDLAEDPLQRVNLWSDPERRSIRDDLGTALEDALPERSQPMLMAESPV